MATVKEVTIPDIGSAQSAAIIEILIKPGDVVKPEDTLVTLEGEKATMEIPSPYAGKIQSLRVKIGDKVSMGTPILTMEVEEEAPGKSEVAPEVEPTPPKEAAPSAPLPKQLEPVPSGIHAGPAVRGLAKELGVDLNALKGTGQKGRITKEDLHAHIKQAMRQGGGALPPPPLVDFSQFGPIKIEPLSRINKLSSTNLHRNWLLIPHVTQFDEADITDLEAYRKTQLIKAEAEGFKLTTLTFIMKAVTAALKKFPRFNASLSPNGEELILKQYYHLGVAVDTPQGLVVPVIRNVDQKGILELAKELGEVSKKAREGKLNMKDMQGSTFSISSLGGIGGTAFTPIVNMPDVAILGVSRSSLKPIYQNGQWVPRLMLPLSLSYDHRVIDGAEGARFITFLSTQLSDIRNVLL